MCAKRIDPDKVYYQTCDCCCREFNTNKVCVGLYMKVNRVCPRCGYDNTRGSEIAHAHFSGEFARRNKLRKEQDDATQS